MHKHSVANNMSKTTKQQSINEQLKEQFINHCACIIQSRFKGYLARKRYNQFLPIYRRIKMLLTAIWKGWKTRKILKLHLMKQKVHDIKAKSEGSFVRIAKREFFDDFTRLWKNGNWVDLLNKEKYQKSISKSTLNSKQNSKKISNIPVIKSIKDVFKSNKKSNTSNPTTVVNLKQIEEEKEEILKHKIQQRKNNPFDEIPIKTCSAIQFQQKIRQELETHKQKSSNKIKKSAPKKLHQKQKKDQMIIQLPLSNIEKPPTQNTQRKKINITLSTRQQSRFSTVKSIQKEEQHPYSNIQLNEFHPSQDKIKNDPKHRKMATTQEMKNSSGDDIFELNKVYNSAYLKKWHELDSKLMQIHNQNRYSRGICVYSRLC